MTFLLTNKARGHFLRALFYAKSFRFYIYLIELITATNTATPLLPQAAIAGARSFPRRRLWVLRAKEEALTRNQPGFLPADHVISGFYVVIGAI